MNILIIGGGGREHALAWKIRQSPLCGTLYCAPGNPGIAELAECLDLDLKPPYGSLLDWCKKEKIDLVVVGPEDPLAHGIVDALAGAGIEAFGPRAAGAKIEASKKFAKEIMASAGIPTASAKTFASSAEAIAHLDHFSPPYVIKADGLAAGKGVTVAATREEAVGAIRSALDEKVFGSAGSEVLIEEYLQGFEASLLAFTDGRTVRAMDSAEDHKPLLDGDKGPNTGGMGTISPSRMTEAHRREAIVKILEPCVTELRRRGIDYRGVLYAGLMVTREGPKVIEFNCRFGDPETQVLLPRLENDLVEVMLACVRGTLDQIQLRWRSEACVCVVAASGGYPGSYEKGKIIEGLDAGDVAQPPSAEKEKATEPIVFHAGTAKDAQGRIVTSGGRVLGVTSLGKDLPSARAHAYARLSQIHFEGMQYRKDIGNRPARAIS